MVLWGYVDHAKLREHQFDPPEVIENEDPPMNFDTAPRLVPRRILGIHDDYSDDEEVGCPEIPEKPEDRDPLLDLGPVKTKSKFVIQPDRVKLERDEKMRRIKQKEFLERWMKISESTYGGTEDEEAGVQGKRRTNKNRVNDNPTNSSGEPEYVDDDQEFLDVNKQWEVLRDHPAIYIDCSDDEEMWVDIREAAEAEAKAKAEAEEIVTEAFQQASSNYLFGYGSSNSNNNTNYYYGGYDFSAELKPLMPLNWDMNATIPFSGPSNQHFANNNSNNTYQPLAEQSLPNPMTTNQSPTNNNNPTQPSSSSTTGATVASSSVLQSPFNTYLPTIPDPDEILSPISHQPNPNPNPNPNNNIEFPPSDFPPSDFPPSDFPPSNFPSPSQQQQQQAFNSNTWTQAQDHPPQFTDFSDPSTQWNFWPEL